VGGDACALGADRVLRHLHHDLLALPQQGLDLGRLAAVAPAAAGARLLLGVQLRQAGGFAQVVTGIQKGGLLQTDVDERRLHARQHARDAAERDHAGHAAIASSFDVELGETSLLDHRHTGLAGAGVDQDLVLRSGLPRSGIQRHCSRLRRWRADSGSDRGLDTRVRRGRRRV
jgi:hypothetical protein